MWLLEKFKTHGLHSWPRRKYILLNSIRTIFVLFVVPGGKGRASKMLMERQSDDMVANEEKEDCPESMPWAKTRNKTADTFYDGNLLVYNGRFLLESNDSNIKIKRNYL